MKKLIALCAVVSILGGTSAMAAPPKDKKPAKTKKVAKATDVWVCPITGEKITEHTNPGKGEVVDGKVVHFCCAGCDGKFAAMSAAEKKAKMAEAAKKDAPAKKS